MTLRAETEAGYRAIRSSVALTEESDLRCLRFAGPGAFEVLDAVCPCDVFLQDGQMKHTLLLDERGIPFADVYACREGERTYLLGYGPPADEITDWITHHATGVGDYSITDLRQSHSSFALDGPYAWELCADVVGPDVLGLPYLSMFALDDILVFRAGRTGEYGYHLLVPTDQASVWREKLLATGSEFNAAWADAGAYSQCVLESLFFDFEKEGRFGLTPFELQLQWRLSHQKTAYPGADAVRALRNAGWSRRLTCFVMQDSVSAQEVITCDGEAVGSVLAAGYSPLRGDYVGKALLHRPYWHAGLDAFRVGNRTLKTISAPAIDNLSLKVNPYRHSYRTREGDLA